MSSTTSAPPFGRRRTRSTASRRASLLRGLAGFAALFVVAELVSGRLRAGLDVFANEPDVPSELHALDNVVMTPHLGTATEATREAMTRALVNNLLAVERRARPPNAV